MIVERYKAPPCRNCQATFCDGIQCEAHQKWFVDAWERIHQRVWQVMDDSGREEHFRYYLPHERAIMDKSPCTNCPCSSWCEYACSRRLKWWDIQMAKLRHALGYRGCDNE